MADDEKNEQAPTNSTQSGDGHPGEAPTGDAGEPRGDGFDRDSAEEERTGDQRQTQDERGHFIVGVGASAGGLEALELLVKNIEDANAAIVVIQHLSPRYESALTQLLARGSKNEIVTATDGAPLEPNRIYVIPPDADLSVFHGTLHVTTPATTPHFPIDYFFRWLAQDQGAYALGVILSGTGTDGTLGLAAIKAAGGITFVQEPSSARYDGMPRSALARGTPDFCLTPEEIGRELSRLTRDRRLKRIPPLVRMPQTQDDLARLFMLIRAEFGNDLTQYKPATLDRRIERRMTMHKIGQLKEYVKFVQSDRGELASLYKDMLITVTSFFRDPAAFEALKTKVFPKLLQQRDSRDPLRVWVPACASGEEAYSIAMCLLEFLEDREPNVEIQIFGTDVDEDSIQDARRGVYAQNISVDVSADRLTRFFTRQDSDYHVTRRIRDLVVFSKQNILKDAPFSRIDLVSCRNLLIYLQPSAQKKVLRIIHYALKRSGFLLLGASETVGDAPELFSLVDRKGKIYSKRAVTPAYTGLDVNFGFPVPPEARARAIPGRVNMSLQAVADREVLDLYGPPGVVINEMLEITQFRGHTGRYLDPAPGTATFNILRLVRPSLHIDLKRIIEEAIAQEKRVSSDVLYSVDEKQISVRLDVIPLEDPETKGRCFLVLFHALPSPKEVPVVASGPDQGQEALRPLTQRIRELEGELSMTRDYLFRTNQEKESATEQLQAANEELQSSNEELQSINEELETSKEEMQSTNEELTTVNEELHNRMAELSQINDDLHNVLATVDIAVIIVGLDLRIRRYTAAAEKLFRLSPSDIGRPIEIVDPFLEPNMVESKVSTVIETLSSLEEDVLAKNRRWHALRISPYKTLDHSIRGALVTLTDIDSRKRAREVARVIVDKDSRVVWVNEDFLTNFQPDKGTLGRLLPDVLQGHFDDQLLRDLADRVVKTEFSDERLPLVSPGRPSQMVRVHGSRLRPSGTDQLTVLSLEFASGP